MERIRYHFEKNIFGVCSFIGERIGISTARIRLYFIYASCLSFGSPLLIYLVFAFFINVRKYIRIRKNIAWYN